MKKITDIVFTKRFWMALTLCLVPVYLFLLSRETYYTDYCYFLHPWVMFIRSHDGIFALRETFSNYTPSYLYFLVLISYLPCEPLVPIRILSLIFQVIGGVYLGKIAYLKYRQDWVKPASFFLMLALPTLILNGSYWSQCDSVYTTLIIVSLYYLLAKKPIWSLIWIGVAMSFKLQTVFIIPLYVLLWMRGDFKPWAPLVAIGAMFAVWIPALLVGVQFLDLFYPYIAQIRYTYGYILTLAGVWFLLPHDLPYSWWTTAGVLLAIALFGIWIYFRTRGKAYSDSFIVSLAMLIAATVPMILPTMHERYMYLVDVLAIAYVFYFPRMWLPAVGLQFVSLWGYIYYLSCCPGWEYFHLPLAGFIPVSIVYLFCTAALFYDFFKHRLPALKDKKPASGNQTETSPLIGG